MIFLRYESFRQYVRWYPVTTAILALNLLFFAETAIMGDRSVLMKYGALVHWAPYNTEVWRYVMSMFLHGGFDHLLFNMFAVFVFAPPLEYLLGSLKYSALYFGSGIIGNVASILLNEPGTVSVGASGAILTKLMADAMNRSIGNIMLGGFGTGDSAAVAAGAGGGQVRSVSADDAAIQLAYASKVVIVPGYGLAAAQAQHQVQELASLLEARGVEVSYAIHPVAGRMPGHMNVLLAEANVPYSQLKEMEEINPEFPQVDVALVIGANDVTNPAARRPGTAISGMPILDVDKAKSVIVVKRSMGHGYAGIDNELYTDPKTGMYFADAKKALSEMTAAVKLLVG